MVQDRCLPRRPDVRVAPVKQLACTPACSTPPSQWLLASLSPDCPLRPGEYLKQNGKIDHPNLLTAKETYGWFKTVAYRADQISE